MKQRATVWVCESVCVKPSWVQTAYRDLCLQRLRSLTGNVGGKIFGIDGKESKMCKL